MLEGKVMNLGNNRDKKVRGNHVSTNSRSISRDTILAQKRMPSISIILLQIVQMCLAKYTAQNQNCIHWEMPLRTWTDCMCTGGNDLATSFFSY